jgi:MFS family permease
MIAVDCHGLRNFGSIFGLMTLFSIVGAAAGPPVVGYMYDAGNSYRGAFILLIALTLLSAYCIYMAKPKERFEVETFRAGELDEADAT